MHAVSKVGIDDVSVYVPHLYLPIRTLAKARNLEYAKLNKGLGLEAMSVPDAHEDVATMAANAVLCLLLRHQLRPRQIGRIYLGTESSVDGSKPMASYVIDMLTQYFAEDEGKDCFLNCDVVDMTFACIGAVDALQNTADWVRGGEERIGIVVGSDIARYELGSGGEYTQGAGAVALLVRQNPQLLSLQGPWGVASRSVHDFFKPLRAYTKEEVAATVLSAAGHSKETAAWVTRETSEGWLQHADEQIYFHRETPVFDGPYSNACYQQRIGEALQHYACQAGIAAEAPVTDDWHRLIFHLPYAYQARRMFSELYMEESQKRGDWEQTAQAIDQAMPQRSAFDTAEAYEKARAGFLRAITKTERYRRFLSEKIEKGERASSLVGNLYTSSIFLSLLSTLEADLAEGSALAGTDFGFFAYGSGSKSKVFTATVEEGWRERVAQWRLMAQLQGRQELDYATYERLHRGQQKASVSTPENSFFLQKVERKDSPWQGARYYGWKAGSEHANAQKPEVFPVGKL